jgi:hypothetical protein
MSGCCSIDVECTPDFSVTKIVTARTAHKCCECHSEIKPGQTYENVKGKWEGKIVTFKTCLPCSKIRNEYCSDGFEYGGLCETLYECLGFDYITGEMRDNQEDEEWTLSKERKTNLKKNYLRVE